MDGKIQFQKGDVTLVRLDPEVCDDCQGSPAEFCISLDLRGMGAERGFGRYCENCGEDRVQSIRATLPDDTDDGTVPS